MLRRLDRVLWAPPIPLAILVYFAVRISVSGLTGWRLFSTIWIVIWSGLALYNWRSGDRVLRWLHSEPPPDEPDGPDEPVN